VTGCVSKILSNVQFTKFVNCTFNVHKIETSPLNARKVLDLEGQLLKVIKIQKCLNDIA